MPDNFIAQEPVIPRDSSKLLVLNRADKSIKHLLFYQITDYLNKGDLLILNDTKVFPARLLGRKEHSGGKVEVLLLSSKDENTWETLVKPGKKALVGTTLVFDDKFKGEVLAKTEQGGRVIHFNHPVLEMCREIGKVPLPPYIRQEINNPDLYQTVYAKETGSVAAPTAGFHFTQELLAKIKTQGVKVMFVTLHVGLGTFRPVKTEDILQHKMEKEYFTVPEELLEEIKQTKEKGRKVFVVGTTAVRSLETASRGKLEGYTDLFIYPGFEFKMVDRLITNFHLPCSTLLMLVCAFAGREKVIEAYQEAMAKNYRFYSFGDAMLII